MHRLITCDDVFEVLTRGPFPTGEAVEDAEVEAHLHACHDCRQLAEALRPATGLLREALPEEGLPVFQSSLTSAPWMEPSATGENAAGSPPTIEPSRPSRASMWMMHGVRLAGAAMLIGLLLGAVQLAAMMQSGNTSAVELREQLSTAPMPPQCRLALVGGSSVDAAKENCCSSCHTAAVAVHSNAPMHRLVATSCRTCHE